MSENYYYSSLSGDEIEETLIGSVVFNKSQSLTTSQKARARANIGAGEGSTSFVIKGFFATLDDLRAYLQMLPEVGDAYGISEEPDAASEFLSPDGTQTSFTLSDDAQPYAITVTDTGTSTVLTPGTDYTYNAGVITFPTAPAAGTDSYEVEWYDKTAPYHIYVWDGVTDSWIDNGVLIGAEVIDDNDTVSDKTWSSQKIDNEITSQAAEILQIVYPVGSIYMSVNSASPATIFGFGTWEQIKDTFLLSAGDTYAAGATGGEATHTLTIDELPSHSHNLAAVHYVAGANDRQFSSGGNWQQQDFDTKTTGGGQAHNNMPPYLAVYVWKRTA